MRFQLPPHEMETEEGALCAFAQSRTPVRRFPQETTFYSPVTQLLSAQNTVNGSLQMAI